MANKRLEPQSENQTTFNSIFSNDDESFTDKEKMFCISYCTDARFNQTEAARRAGYNAKNDLSLRVIASGVMAKRKIKEKINQILESFVAPKMQILYQLQQQANGSILDVMNDQNQLDLSLARERGTDTLIQEIYIEENIVETKRESNETTNLFGDETNDQDEIIETNAKVRRIKFKIYSAQKALELLGKHYGLFADNLKISNPDGTPIGSNGDVVLFLPDNGRDDAPYLKLSANPDASKPKKTTNRPRKSAKSAQNALKRKTEKPKNSKK